MAIVRGDQQHAARHHHAGRQATTVLAINDRYRKPMVCRRPSRPGLRWSKSCKHRVESGLFTGDVTKYLAAIVARIAKRQPSIEEIVLTDGRIISIQERSMEGGGWVRCTRTLLHSGNIKGSSIGPSSSW